MSDEVRITDVSRPDREPLLRLERDRLMPLAPPLDDASALPPLSPLSASARERFETGLDDTCAVSVPQPKTPEEERELVGRFLSGLDKLFQRENNWTFLQPLAADHGALRQVPDVLRGLPHLRGERRGEELYRPTYRSEIMRRLYFKYVKNGGLLSAWQHGDITVNWPLVARLIELAYRCNLCRRCAQTCPIGADNGLVAHEIRKVFSQEMGIAPKEIHENGSMLQLKVGSSTGMTPAVVKDNIEFIDEDMSERTGIEVKTPWDVEGADILLIHNAGEIMAWPENPGAFAIILNAAGISWTLSSELAGYDAINYGLWYDDVQFARVAIQHAEAAAQAGGEEDRPGRVRPRAQGADRHRRPGADGRPRTSRARAA